MINDRVFDEVMAALGLRARPQQTELTARIRHAKPTQPVFAQAGTGTGKSYVLLSAAVASHRATGKPSVVVCPTNALVDQYVHKDAPVVCEAAGATFTHLKGRNRYLCAASRELRELRDAAADRVKDLIEEYGTADLDVIGKPPEGYGCPGSKRCSGDACGAMLARQQAAGFHVIITNAHVLVWDRRVRDWTGDAVALLPDYGALLVDECHELDAAARGCLSDQVTQRSRIYGLVPGFSPWVRKRATELKRGGQSEELFKPDSSVEQWRDRIESAADALHDQIASERSQDAPDWDQIRHLRDELETHQRFLDLFSGTDQDGARFITTIDSDANINRQCVDASQLTGRVLQGQTSVLVSGTVPTSLPARLGSVGSTVTDVGHPFDYGRSRLIISRHDAKSPSKLVRSQRVASLVEAVRQVGGGTLVLFTSWADLEEVMPKVDQALNDGARRASRADEIPVYVQSREEPATLKDDIDAFRKDGNAVLAGVRSLFTGIDIPGPALRQVVLWKLPFPVPTLERQAIGAIHGRQVYFDEMLTSLAQGVGRLVRQAEDSGRVLILDNRAKTLRWPASPLTAHLAEFTS